MRVTNRGEAVLDVQVITELFKGSIIKFLAIVGNDSMEKFEPTNNRLLE